MCPPKHIHKSTQKPLVPPCMAPKFSVPGRREVWRASNGDGGRFESEIGTYGRGQGRKCQNGEPLQGRRREREEVSRKMGARQASSPSSRLQRGSENSRPGPSREQAWGTSPRCTGQEGAGKHPAIPIPCPHPKLRNGGDWQQQPLGSARAWGGGGGQAGRQTKCHQPGHGVCQPTVPTPPAPVQSPYAWSFGGRERWGPVGIGGPADKARSPQTVGRSPRPYKDGAAWHCQGDGLW